MEAFWVYVTYVASAAGALAIYLAMPPSARSRSRAALGLGAVALGAMLVVLHQLAGESGEHITFGLLSFLAIGAAARVITHSRPVYSALYFVMVVLSTSGMAVLAGAEFLAAALVIVYAGAILVTYVFVIMLAQQPGSTDPLASSMKYDAMAREPGAAVLAGFVLVATIAGVIVGREWPGGVASEVAAVGNTLAIGDVLLHRFAVSVELAGVLLMVAMIGAIAIARKRIPRADEGDESLPPGEIGRRAKPF